MRIAMGSIAARLAVVAVMLLVAGCARSDWIESTLVTVDVSGEWVGATVVGGGTNMSPIGFTPQQTGAKVTGQLTTGGINSPYGIGVKLEGTVNGDIFRFTFGAGRQFELVVSGDEMHGRVDSRYGLGVIDLRRTR